MFTIDSNGDLVGYSDWEPDLLYAPLVGYYRDGRLIAVTACDRPPQTVDLAGPRSRCWFRMSARDDDRDQLREGNPAVKLLRAEDAMPIRMSHPPAARQLRRVEDFLTSASRPTTRLTGFTAFLGAPFTHQLDILFLDFLGRLPDPGARLHYLDQIKRGKSPLAVRDELLLSEEFRNRRLTVSDRIGSLVTSPIWQLLADAEPLDEARVSLPRVSLGDHDEVANEDFAARFYATCTGEEAGNGTLDTVETVRREGGRGAAAAHLVRHLAGDGRFIDLVA